MLLQVSVFLVHYVYEFIVLPRPIGNEFKNMSDGQSNIVLNLELYEGKDIMSQKQHVDDKTNQMYLWYWLHHCCRLMVWLGVMALHNVGLYSIILVKTAHCLFPKDELNATEIQRGEWIGLHTTHEDVDLQAKPYDYLQYSASIDVHNHVRTGSVELEDSWQTKQPHHRQFASILVFSFTNAYLGFKYYKEKDCKHSNFKMALANLLINR